MTTSGVTDMADVAVVEGALPRVESVATAGRSHIEQAADSAEETIAVSRRWLCQRVRGHVAAAPGTV